MRSAPRAVAPERDDGAIAAVDRVSDAMTRIPWWMLVLAVFALGRAVSTVMLLVYASQQPTNPWTAGQPGYFDYANIWDGRWYQIVAGYGYPSELPTDASGHVTENAWAFMPVFPFTVSAVMLTGLSWQVSAVVVSLAFATGASLLFYRLLQPRLGASTALFAVVLLNVAPVSPIFQVAYAESMQVFFIVLALLLLAQRRFAWMFPVIIVLSFTRPGAVAFALAMVIYFGYRWWRRRDEAFPLRERIHCVALAAVSAVAGFAWLVIAGLVTGSLTAYTDTELAWRAPYIGRQHLVPFAAWFQGGNWWLGFPLGTIAVLALIVAFALLMASRPARRLGIEAWAWSAAYACYLLAVFFPQSSTFRLLLPLFPLLAVFALPRNLAYRAVIVVAFVVGQWLWLGACWSVVGLDWTPP